MKRWLQLGLHGLRVCLESIGSVALWSVWLALVILLVAQIYIATAHELALPGFVLRRIESRLAEVGVRANFQRTSFDPTGRVLMENVSMTLPGFTEPVLTARAAYVRLNPWMLAVGMVEPAEVRVIDAGAVVPAMLSPSGRPEPLVRDLHATIERSSRLLTLRQISGKVAGIAVSAHGSIQMPRVREKPAADSFMEAIAKHFPAFCRQAVAFADELARLERPQVHLEISPSESGAIAIEATALARHVRLDEPVSATLTDVRASTRLLLFGEAPPSHIEISAAEAQLPGETVLTGVNALVAGRLRPGGKDFDLREALVTADRVTSAGVEVRAIAARIFPRPLPGISARVSAHVIESPLGIDAEVDLKERSAGVRFAGTLSPRILDVLSRRFGVNVRKYYDFDSITAERAEARLGAGWTFEKLTARVRVPRMNSYGVIMEDGRTVVELTPDRFFAPEAFARVGENFARGSYEHDLRTHQYRFLLDGRLRPMAIADWFREWWPAFFQQLDFAAAAPVASVDVRGTWREGRSTSVFVFADVAKPVIRGTPLDRVRTRLFIRPAFYDAPEIFAQHGAGTAQGRFMLLADTTSHVWDTLEFALDSTLDLAFAGQLLGPAIAGNLAPFQLERPPELKLRGTFRGPAAAGRERDQLRIEARTFGAFRFHDFPMSNVSFIATLNGDETVLDDVSAMFGGGVATGRARVWGQGADRRLGFDYSLRDASLGEVAGALSQFFAAKKGQPPAPPGKFLREKANVRMDISASAEGRYADALSYRGEGNAVLRGAEIGEVHLLGLLSELLKFTSLRFTEARGNFKIEGAKLHFPAVTLRGANSAIDAHGDYFLDRRELEFNAKVFPFQESESLIKSVVGAVLTPLSNALEVKLSGTIDKPQWAFVMGPTNLLRSLAPGDPENKPPPATEPKPPPSTP